MMKKVLFGLSVYISAMLFVWCISSLFSPSPKQAYSASIGDARGAVVITENAETITENAETITENGETITESPFDFSVNIDTEKEAFEKAKKIDITEITKVEAEDLTSVLMTEMKKRRKKKGGGVMPAVLRIRGKDGKIYTIPAIRGEKGSSIQGIERTEGDGSAGTTDTYTLTMSGGETFTFQVKNGADGKTHKAGNHILIDENDEISVDMAESISEEEQRPISPALALQTFQTITSAVKLTTGSYVGDGTYGVAHPVVLTFGFVPKFVIVAVTNDGNDDYVMWITGCSAMLYKSELGAGSYALPATLQDQTLSFYSVTSAEKQFNDADVTYHFIAFG